MVSPSGFFKFKILKIPSYSGIGPSAVSRPLGSDSANCLALGADNSGCGRFGGSGF